MASDTSDFPENEARQAAADAITALSGGYYHGDLSGEGARVIGAMLHLLNGQIPDVLDMYELVIDTSASRRK